MSRKIVKITIERSIRKRFQDHLDTLYVYICIHWFLHCLKNNYNYFFIVMIIIIRHYRREKI